MASPVGATASDTRAGGSGAWTINLSSLPSPGSEVIAAVAVNNWSIANPISTGVGWTQIYKDQNLGSEADAQIQVRTSPDSTGVLWDNVEVAWDQTAAGAAIELRAGGDCDGMPEGAMLYNSAYKVMQFCNGQDWIAIGKSQ